MTDSIALQIYVERYFVPLDELARLGGVSLDALIALIAAHAIPGPIYSLWSNGAFWSPIGGQHGPEPVGAATHWYAPAAAWWVRRSHGLTPAAAAIAFKERFIADFVTRLASEPQGHLGYPKVYQSGSFDPHAAAEAARSEWRDWIDGGYGVCLRQADAHHAITKTCRRAAIVAITDEGRATRLTPEQTDLLLTAMEQLDAVMLPFAPHQRPNGTPGLWLDAMLARYGLGTTREAISMAPAAPATRLCA